MRHLDFDSRSVFRAVVAAGLVSGALLAVPVPADAAPGCLQYGFSGPTEIVSSGRTIVTFNGDGPNVNTSATTNNLTVPINGFVDANKYITLTVTMPGVDGSGQQVTETYSGAVGDDGMPHGKIK